MLIPEGTEFTLKGNNRIRTGRLLAAGGEGLVYEVVQLDSGMPGVFKAFKQPSRERLQRTRFLVDQRLNEVCELLCAPIDYAEQPCLGHLSPLAPGQPLEDYLQQPSCSYDETYKLAIALSLAFARLEQCGICHGDPSLNQALVLSTPVGLEIRLIDYDNFVARGAPAPLCLGQEDRMAPELRRSLATGADVGPDAHTDRYAHATIMHDMLLARHVAAGLDDTPEDFDRAMSGGWPTDPLFGSREPLAGGFPSQILNAELAAMMRRGLSREPAERPSAGDWIRVLNRNYTQIYVDPRCGGPSFIDPSRTQCPICGEPFPTYRLVFPSLRKSIPCDRAVVAIGRADLGSPSVSSLHAVVRRYGQETRLEPRGRNGTYRWNGSHWAPFDHTVILGAGDRLRFAGVEGHVEEIH